MNENDPQLIKLGMQLDKQRSLLRRIQGVYEMERREWARLLHDEFGQSLAAIKSFAVGIKNNTEMASETHDLADIIQNTANELYVSAYDLMRGLRSGFIEDMGLLDGIQVCIENSRLAQLGVEVQVQSDGEVESLGHLLNVVILRIVQESLSGLIRSSSPSQIAIFIVVRESNLYERRKHQRHTESELTTTLPPLRKILEVQIRGYSEVGIEFANQSSIFQRTQDYIEAFGGDYSLKKIENTSIEMLISLDITELIEDSEVEDKEDKEAATEDNQDEKYQAGNMKDVSSE